MSHRLGDAGPFAAGGVTHMWHRREWWKRSVTEMLPHLTINLCDILFADTHIYALCTGLALISCHWSVIISYINVYYGTPCKCFVFTKQCGGGAYICIKATFGGLGWILCEAASINQLFPFINHIYTAYE